MLESVETQHGRSLSKSRGISSRIHLQAHSDLAGMRTTDIWGWCSPHQSLARVTGHVGAGGYLRHWPSPLGTSTTGA